MQAVSGFLELQQRQGLLNSDFVNGHLCGFPRSATTITILLFQKFPHIPNVIGYPSSHCGRGSERLVNAAEMVKGEPARDSGPVMLKALAKRTKRREASKANFAHAYYSRFGGKNE